MDVKSVVYEVLAEYQLYPKYIERIGKVYKVVSEGRVFALKETDIRASENLFVTYPLLYNKGFYRFLPLYKTQNGQFAVLRNKKLYYLSPWIGGERPVETNHTTKMLKELARLHFLTSKETKTDKTDIEQHYEQTSTLWKRELKYLERWAEQCEQKWYMSPFEWEFVQYFNEFYKAYEYALRTFTMWKNTILESNKIRTVLLHGNVSRDHFVYDEKGYGYFINFEQSRFGASYQDLLPFFSKTLRTYPIQGEDYTTWLTTYMKSYPLTESEILLLKSYLAHPGFIITLLNRYDERSVTNHEYKSTKRIQKAYWQLKNIEKIIMQLEMGSKS